MGLLLTGRKPSIYILYIYSSLLWNHFVCIHINTKTSAIMINQRPIQNIPFVQRIGHICSCPKETPHPTQKKYIYCSFFFLLHTPNNAPLVSSPSFTRHSLCSPKHHISPLRPKQKFAHPPSIKILPTSMPPLFHTLMPSPHPAYTLPYTSHLMPSGAPVSAYAKTRRLVRYG